jgi:hypothetical protein
MTTGGGGLDTLLDLSLSPDKDCFCELLLAYFFSFTNNYSCCIDGLTPPPLLLIPFVFCFLAGGAELIAIGIFFPAKAAIKVSL